MHIQSNSAALSDDIGTDQKLGLTARWTAAIRAYENTREDRLFSDPWATMLAGQKGREWVENRSVDSIVPIILRTRYFDDFLQQVESESQP